ncbi:hypothetical protein IFM89_025584 [Coptis chinensis]|uniref:GDSL esterase/lipase n=1 Tax=Coptis chinensis TaxID=261450 RepID=A0A835GZ34_9MAGN|nr:hypothetical protein IFM89_025584 [Coptis chinensis]
MTGCQDLLRNSLFLVGEIGGNDYNYPFFKGRSSQESRTFVPKVIDAVSSAIENELSRLREIYPHANIIYADYYKGALQMSLFPTQLGFTGGALEACCGGGGPYNYNLTIQCGYNGSNVCDDPSTYVNWDGIHLTEAAYRWIATGILDGSFTNPPTVISCIQST